jgi:methyl-accepting chemotaxis protein
MELRKKLMVVFILISIIPFLAGIGIIMLTTSSTIRYTTQGFLTQYSAATAGDILAFFERKTGLAESASFFPGLAEMAWPEKKQALYPLIGQLANTDGIRIYLYANNDGTYYRSDEPGNPARGGLITADNKNPDAAPNLISARDYFQVLVKNNTGGEHRVHVSNPILSVATGQKQVIAGSTVINASGEAAGLLGFYIEDHTMEETLNAITLQMRENFGERLHFFIFSENNTILSRREYDPVQDKYTEQALTVNQEFTIDDLPDNLRQACKDVITGSSLSYRDESGEQYYITSSAVADTGYRVVLALPEAVLYETILTIEKITALVLAATIILVFFLAFFLSVRITSPIVKTALTLKDISEGEGDLTKTISVTTRDELGDLARYFNATVDKIKALVFVIKNQAIALFDIGSELASNMTETAAAINEITANIKNIKGRVINQSASVTETNANMEQITANIDKLSDHVGRQGDSVARSSSAIEEMLANIQSVTQTLIKNGDNVKNLSDASELGRAGLQEVATDIQEIARESEGILEINAVMQNIASQTNLLSMNAAIEAAHAGEAGKGFAVVADEIRKLAESSGEQSKTISTVLKKIKDSIDKITKSTNSVLGKFEAIDSGVKTVSEQEENIRNAMEEQSVGSKQILEAIGQLNEMTQLVKGSSAEMLEESRQVIAESKNLELMTQEISHGMNEMATGAEQINVAVNRVHTISGENKKSIDVLVQEVSKFKVE